MRYQGKITNWKDDRGFGFITPSGGGKQVFVHAKSFSNRQRRPAGNEMVTYELKMDSKGRAQAGSVIFAGERVPSPTLNNNAPLAIASSFLIFVAWVTFTGRLPFTILWLYLAASITTFIVYAFDKSAARKDQWRTQESTLHLLAIVGGWPGALTAQKLFRHKSRKQSFQIVFWATVVINCGTLGWLLTHQGTENLHTVLRIIQKLTSQYL
jgi:uncharacterized membrane protein YsdA (DUF1294 family)/cold shock CspA family protein